MSKRTFAIGACVTAIALGTGASYAFGGGSGIWDDGTLVRPGSLDDGKNLLPQTRITLADAVAKARAAASGALGQVDLKEQDGGIAYVVDVGDQEVSVDAVDGTVIRVGPQT
jgi:uncharacterized membrane protein YkoI